MFDQAVVNGIESKFQPVGDAKFVEDVMQVIFDRLFADEEFSRDLFVPATLRHQLHDLLFAIAEQCFIPARPFVGTLAESLHHLGGDVIVQPNFAAVDPVDALDQQIARGLLQNDAAGAETHRSHGIALVFRGG